MRILLSLILLAFLAILCVEARADSEVRHGADFVRLTAAPCVDEAVRAQIALAGEDPEDFRAAVAHMDGQDFAGCWRPDFQRRAVFLHYQDGDAGVIPFDALKPVRET